MKLVLIQPPVQDFYDTTIRLQPIGLCYLKATVKKFLPEADVVVRDYHHGWGRRTVALPEDLAYLKDYYRWPDRSPFSTFYHYYHFGASFEQVGEAVVRERPDVVGISSLFSPYCREVLACAREIRRRLRVPILVGGAHVSAAPLRMLEDPQVDFVIRGEGERPLVEFLKAWMKDDGWYRVPNLGFKENGRLILNEVEENYPIEDLPVPDLSDFSIDRYTYERRPLVFLITSRGCPYRCSFCSSHLTFGKKYRRRSPDAVIDEIKRRYRDGYRVFDFEDDNLVVDVDTMKALCHRLIDTFPSGEVQCLAMNGILFPGLDRSLLELMKRAGFTHLNLSLVSIDPGVRERTGRPRNLDEYRAVVEEAVRLGFKIVSYQILGLPQENLETMIQTLVFNARLPVLLGASPFYMTPGSNISKDFPEPAEGDIVKSRLTAMAVETSHFAREDLYTLFVTSRIINFLKGIPCEKRVTTLAEALCSARSQGKRAALGAELLGKLLREKQLCAATKNDFRTLSRFRSDLFLRIWSSLEHIGTQDGKMIRLR